MTEPRSFAILDTDIGTDVDDILALVALERIVGDRLIGITTVHGDTALRARLAQYVCNQLGLSNVTVAAGETGTIGGRPVDRGWKGSEGDGIPNLDSIEFDAGIDGVDFLCEQARNHPGQIDLIAIGPLTNVAAAMQRDASFAGNLRHLYIMGGAFWLDCPEHNILCDPEAAAIVFDSRIPMTVCGLDVTLKVLLREPGLVAIREALGELGASLEVQVRDWWAFRETQARAKGRIETITSNHLHDPLALMPMVHPELFTFQRGTITIYLSEQKLAWSHFHQDENGNALVASDVNVAAAEQIILDYIVGSR